MGQPWRVAGVWSRVLVCAAVLVGASVAWASASGATGGGSKVWVARYNAPLNGNDFANSTAASPDGTKVFVTGSTKQGGGYGNDFTTIAYSVATGAQLWSRVYNSGGGNADIASAVVVSPDGTKVFVAGSSFAGNRWTTIAYNAATGAELWRSTTPSVCCQTNPAQLALAPNGTTVFMTSLALNTQYTIAYDATTGAQKWLATFDARNSFVVPSALGRAIVSQIVVSLDSGTVVVTATGFSTPSQSNDYVTVAYQASTGSSLWTAHYNGVDGPYEDVNPSVAMSPSGTFVVVSGTSFDGSDDGQFGTVAYATATGAVLWDNRVGDSTRLESPVRVVVSPGGDKAFVTGSQTQPGGSDYQTVGYDTTTGAQLWSAATVGQSALATAMGITGDGAKVFVTGWATNFDSRGNDFTTLAYDAASGAQLWESRHNFSTEDRPAALAVIPNGSRVVVTGSTQGAQSTDYMTEMIAT